MLVDKYTSSFVDLKTQQEYKFAITSDPASQGNNRFYIIATNVGALPVTFIGLSATLNNDHSVDLNWQTASEINCQAFYIQRSHDGVNFSDIGTLSCKGSKAGTAAYFFRDLSPGHEPVYYYRVKSVDFDGTVSLSNTAVIRLSDPSTPGVSCFPNPAHSQFNVEVTGSKMSGIGVEICDVTGNILRSSRETADVNGKLRFSGDLGDLKPGMYFIRLTSDDKTWLKVIPILKSDD